MKKTVILIVFLCGFSAVYSQTMTLKDYERMIIAKDSLQKKAKSLQDSILIITKKHNNELSELNNKISKANKELEKAENKISDMNKNTVKIERDKLQQQVKDLQTDTVDLRRQLSEKDRQIADVKIESDKKVQEQYAAGQQNAFRQIERSYQVDFDNLIKSSTKHSVERDLPFVVDNTIKKKMHDLQKYFAAKHVLSEQYNEQKVKDAQKNTENLEQTELVKNLIDKLEKYKMCNDGLESVIKKICEIDKTFTANDTYTQDTKNTDILSILLRYFYDYHSFSLIDYPYLSDIILEIIKRKQNDANRDISDLLSKL
jgi:septal ring factor EnvC (AmiA/AmiB activator)